MLVPFQTSGARPPLYLVHGMYGIMPVGHCFAETLGPDQPLYGINANGIDGREITECDSQAMVLAYVEEVLDAQPGGPLLLGGMCAGGLIAMEVARELRSRGREVGPLILLDPPLVPPGYRPRSLIVDPRDPMVASHLYERTRAGLLNHAEDLPFDVNDQRRVHLATLAAVNVLVAVSRHRPKAFPWKATVILSPGRAARFFDPQMPWAKLLPQETIAHVLTCAHDELFGSARYDLARIVKFVLDNIVHSEIRTEGGVGCAQNMTRGRTIVWQRSDVGPTGSDSHV